MAAFQDAVAKSKCKPVPSQWLHSVTSVRAASRRRAGCALRLRPFHVPSAAAACGLDIFHAGWKNML